MTDFETLANLFYKYVDLNQVVNREMVEVDKKINQLMEDYKELGKVQTKIRRKIQEMSMQTEQKRDGI